EVIEKGVEGYCEARHAESWDLAGLLAYLSQYFPLAPGTQLPEAALQQGKDGLVEFLRQSVLDTYAAKEKEFGAELCRQVERYVMLQTIDQRWVEYLTQMEHFREGVGLQAYGQRDPLVEYKIEAHKMFEELKAGIQSDIVANIFHVQIVPHEPPPQAPRIDAESSIAAGPGAELATVGGDAKRGRNELCWCGSGKKYKRCHGR
ncbi:MAG: SEC-C metal-binding domain-containing protein, partial [Candidatus Dormibacteraceae bacterium]